MQHKDVVKARNFFECLQNHFAKSPSHLQKILKCLASFDFNRSSVNQFYDAILPLLKGQQFLIEQFNSFFDHLKPKQSNVDDFEEVELGSGSEIEADDFEDVIIPDIKRSLAKVSQACKPVAKGTGGPLSRRFSKLRKDETGERKDGNRDRKEGDDVRIDGYDERNDGYDERNDGYDERNDGYDERNDGYDERNDGYDERNDGYDERNDGYDERNDGYDERNDGYNERNDGEDETKDGDVERSNGYDERNDENVDVSEKYVDVTEESNELSLNNNDEIPDRMIDSDDDVELDDDMLDQENNENEGVYNQSNHSSPSSECRSVYEAFEDYMQSHETIHKNPLTSKSEVVNVGESLDIKNDAVETPSLIGASHVDIDHCGNGVSSSFENWNVCKDERSCSNQVDDEMSNSYEKKTRDILDIAENSHTKVEKVANKVQIDTNASTNIQRKISAQNLQVDEDGKSIIWTREEDKIILQFCQMRGVHENTFEDIARELGEKTAKEVKSRFRILMSLLSRDENDSQSESEDDSCHDDEEM
ncbi:GATA zinc finger domain-containing protein 14-like [Xenia sp. Carnegie-2017]|uniref:GATA zinc finger domain-containing protein 14-like n=1 Tax=Xenia sp. Carnegie-2017 TaxID=2897299 RepID=UPI001F0409B7|nr:GATA zinc finger domain-containing protein 14-like [Xenia sp. Carnegie-2017]